MSQQSGIWLYKSTARHGTQRLVIVNNPATGHVQAQLQRFNGSGAPQLSGAQDIFVGSTLPDALQWLADRHRQLQSRGWVLAMTSGIATSTDLAAKPKRRYPRRAGQASQREIVASSKAR